MVASLNSWRTVTAARSARPPAIPPRQSQTHWPPSPASAPTDSGAPTVNTFRGGILGPPSAFGYRTHWLTGPVRNTCYLLARTHHGRHKTASRDRARVLRRRIDFLPRPRQSAGHREAESIISIRFCPRAPPAIVATTTPARALPEKPYCQRALPRACALPVCP